HSRVRFQFFQRPLSLPGPRARISYPVCFQLPHLLLLPGPRARISSQVCFPLPLPLLVPGPGALISCPVCFQLPLPLLPLRPRLPVRPCLAQRPRFCLTTSSLPGSAGPCLRTRGDFDPCLPAFDVRVAATLALLSWRSPSPLSVGQSARLLSHLGH